MGSNQTKSKQEFNARAYAFNLNIAKNAMKTIEKIKSCAKKSLEQHGDPYKDRPDWEYIFFNIEQLYSICFDNAFAAIENFLQHIGFLLYEDWDSKKSHRAYDKKHIKLLELDQCIEDESKKYSQTSYAELKSEWQNILYPVRPDIREDFAKKRNPLKHIHSEKHEIKAIYVDPSATFTDTIALLKKDTYLDISESDCSGLLAITEKLIITAHTFLDKNKLIFKVNNYYDEKNLTQMNRKKLWGILLCSPYAVPSYSS